MGTVTLQTEGSFPRRAIIVESAEEGGHAAAIGRMIRHLTEMLPDAIELDHDLHEDGSQPPRAPFGRSS